MWTSPVVAIKPEGVRSRRPWPTADGELKPGGVIALLVAVIAACGDGGAASPRPPRAIVAVTLDGAPAAGAIVTQGGARETWVTGDDGRVEVTVDLTVPGERVFAASLPAARIRGATWTDGTPDGATLPIALATLGPDNPDYTFQDPGDPTRNDNTSECAHCHVTINEAWYGSAHRVAASDPSVQDLYRGTASGRATEPLCAAAGGRFVPGSTVKGEPSPSRCELGAGVIPSLNADPDHATVFAGCADCHAPGIDGALGGRDLREATGTALDYGVHCDICHRVDRVDLDAAPGVAGRLVLHRPSEPSTSIALGRWQPLTFGPDRDVPNPRMGLVARDHFHEATLCAGCHELAQPVLVAGATVDPRRFPDGRLPIQTTFAEWRASPLGPDADEDPADGGGTPCQSCHMPPDAGAWNAADLQLFQDVGPGIAAGWPRPPGAVRRHSWVGPRDRSSRMLELAAALTIDKELSDREVVARVTVQNVGPGHALPTGEPMRALIVRVAARCGDTALEATGGDAVPDFGGALAVRAAGDDWTRWPEASVGDVVRVVRRTGAFHDYDGFGRFARAAADPLTPAEKGMPVEEVAGSAAVVARGGDGQVTFDRPLPAGDVAYLGRPDGLPSDGLAAAPEAGAPGFAFARVLAGADGRRMVPHFLAVDVASDNRLLPRASWTSTHRFARPAGCDDPIVTAVLVHRAYPFELAAERGWTLVDSVMAETHR